MDNRQTPKKRSLNFIIRVHNRLISALSGMVALLLICSLCMGQMFGTAYAEEKEEETQTQESETNPLFTTKAAYGPYEMMTKEQRNAYIRIQQFNQRRQQWLQNRLPYTQPRDLEAEAAVAEAVAAKLAQDGQARLAAERAKIGETLNSIWHNPMVIDTYVTSPFGYRWHPVYGYYRMHNGVDLNGSWGDLIVATRGGVVTDAGWNDCAGYYVEIDHGDGFVTEYFHLWCYYVDVGQEVRACEPIGECGSTGTSTGAHLHFGMLYEGEYVDPEDYIDFES